MKAFARQQLQSGTTAVHILHNLAYLMDLMSCHGTGENSNVQETTLISQATSDLDMFDALDGSTKQTDSDDDNPFENLDKALQRTI